MKLSAIELDVIGIQEGKWTKMPGGWECCLRSAASKAARSVTDRIQRERRENPELKGAEPTTEEAIEMTIEVLVEACMVDWRGLEEDDGTPIVFSHERAYAILRDERYQLILDAVADKAGTEKTFLKNSDVEKDAGN